jgi:hypothetical protein
MVEYKYFNRATSPNLKALDEEGVLISGIHYDIENSTMDNKNVDWCRWDEDTQCVTIYFDEALTTADKDKLDTIMESY